MNNIIGAQEHIILLGLCELASPREKNQVMGRGPTVKNQNPRNVDLQNNDNIYIYIYICDVLSFRGRILYYLVVNADSEKQGGWKVCYIVVESALSKEGVDVRVKLKDSESSWAHLAKLKFFQGLPNLHMFIV